MDTLGLREQIPCDYARSLVALFDGVEVDPKRLDSLSRNLTADEVERKFPEFTAAVSAYVDGVTRASATG